MERVPLRHACEAVELGWMGVGETPLGISGAVCMQLGQIVGKAIDLAYNGKLQGEITAGTYCV